jgi:lipopolysaccharide cholinephosphotransferase
MTRDETRAVQTGILREVDAFCSERGIVYFLWAGTLLGAVRHRGFIPWDDDIDLAMPRPDFDRFCREFADAGTGSLRLFVRETHPTYGSPWAKVSDESTRVAESARMAVPMGLNIDIFPMDGWPRTQLRTRLHRTRMRALHRSVSVWASKPRQGGRGRRVKNVFVRAFRPLLDLVPVRFLTGQVTRGARAHDYATAEHVGVTAFRYLERVERWAYGAPVDIEFEGHVLRAGPQDHDRILRGLYGDYMKLPTEAERAALYTHFSAAYWMDPQGSPGSTPRVGP